MQFRKSLILALTLPAVAQTPAFPGAEGYGAYAKGGRGGDVYHVTNLNASGAGSFIEGISTVPSAGRTIVFDVSGYIRLPSGSGGTRMTASKVTIAGQTAPGDGIGFYNNAFRISGDDVVVRHLRFRLGKYGTGGDCLNLDSGSINSILDHLSVQFSTDENISSFSSPPENVTLQYSLNAWGLESHSCGGLWDQNHATSHHNLWAHNHTRNPKARPSGLLEWINNVTFDWDIGFIMGDSDTPATWKSNVIGNYYICPPGNVRGKALEKANLDRNGNPNFSLYMSGNYYDGNGNATLDGALAGYGLASGSYITSASPFSNTGSRTVTTDIAPIGYKKVVSNAGALRLDTGYSGTIRDEVDTILVSKLVNLQRAHITRESDTGASAAGFGVLNSTTAPVDTDRDGMPDFYETALGWAVATQDHNTVLANSGGLLTGTTFMPAGTVSGYNRLEEYLQFLSIPHGTVAKNVSGAATSIAIDLRKFTSGFSGSPTFAVSNITGGSIALSGTGNAIATFTPTENHVGRGRFDFTVTDNAGHAWTQTFALLVANAGLPRDLNWNGAGNLWDSSAINWFRPANGTNVAFSAGDRVAFDQSGIAQPTVSVSSTNSPGSVTVNSQWNYTFSGTGAISSSGELIKRGSGTLNVSNTGTNGFASVSVDEGWLSLGNFAAAGSGKMSLNGGSLYLASGTGNPLEFNAPATISVGSQQTMTGNWTGSQEVTVTGTSSHLWTLSGTWAGFTGSVKLGAGNIRIRLNGNSNTMFGSPNVAVDLGSGTGQIMNRNGGATPIDIGSLSATGMGTVLYGTQTGSANSLYSIGGLNSSTTFAGSISNGGSGSLTSIAKVGSGSLTLTGTSTHTGTTAVNAGTLVVAGSLGNTAVTVASDAVLAGAGTLGGQVTLLSGAAIAPGAASGLPGPITATAGFAASNATFQLDLSSSPSGANDKVFVTGGASSLGGTNIFQINFANGTLGPGDYKLVECDAGVAFGVVGGMSMILATSAPTGTRQTFALNRSASGTAGGNVRLTVTGNAANLLWGGSLNAATWDLNTTANFSGAAPGTFYNLDAVTFDDTSANRSVALTGSLAPRSVIINTAAGYTFGGAGTLDGSGTLTKSGTGALTLSGSSGNSFSGGLTLNAGTGLGSGPVTVNGGVISMHDNLSSYNDFYGNLVVPGGATARLNADSRVDMFGSLSGSGTLDFYTPWVRATLFADWSAFTGTINVLTDASGGDFRMGTSYGFPGFPQANVLLTDKVWAYYTGTLSAGAGTTIEIGALAGTALSVLQGGATGGRALTYRIGGRNTDATFAGGISEQNTGTATNLVKAGTAKWTLSGSGAWNGGTMVEQGILEIFGNFSSAGAVNVAAGATLKLTNGALATDVVNLDSGAGMTAYGTLNSDLNSNGTLECRGFASGTPGNLTIASNLFLGASSITRMRGGISSDRIAVGGDLSLGGILQVSLVPGTTFGRYPLITFGGVLSDSLVLAGIPGGTVAQLSTSVPGRVDLVVGDSDEDGLPDSWENLYFGNLASGPAGDKDGDGQDNAMELLTGTLPNSGASRFAATLSPLGGNQFSLSWPSVPGKFYRIEWSATLAATWAPLITVSAAAAPAVTTSHVIGVTPGAGGLFYRVALDP